MSWFSLVFLVSRGKLRAVMVSERPSLAGIRRCVFSTRILTDATWHYRLCHMSEKLKERRDFILAYWTDAMGEDELRSAFRKKWSWVIAGPKSSAVWYATVLHNLTGRYSIPEAATIEVIRNTLIHGLSRNAFERLKMITNVSGEELGRAIRIPARTLARRQKFEPDESDRILRVASAFQRTIEVLGGLDKARRWFSRPKRALGGKTPLEFCDTEPGAEEVMHLLGRIEHGVFT